MKKLCACSLIYVVSLLNLNGQQILQAIVGANSTPPAPPTYIIVHQSPYSGDPVTTNAITQNQVSGNANFGFTSFCTTNDCNASMACTSTDFTDNADAAGGSADNTYTTDVDPTTNENICTHIARANNIQATTSTITLTAEAGTFYQNVFFIEVSGLGPTPALISSGQDSSSGTMNTVVTAGPCDAGDFAVAVFQSGGGASTPGPGANWTAIGTPSGGQLIMWREVASTGVLTATATGTTSNTGASVACYH